MNRMKRKMLSVTCMALLTTSIMISCEKKDTEILKSDLNDSIKNYDKLLAFYSWSTGVPKESIQFKEDTKEFVISSFSVREKVERVQSEYEKANIYKLNIENK